MKVLKKALLLVLCLSMILGMTACGLKKAGTEKKNYDLTIKFYNGAYGKDWIEKAAEEFGKEKGVNVLVEPSADHDCGAPNNLKSGKNLSDVYFVGTTTWPTWVQNGWLENLNDVYNTPVKTSKGDVKLSEFMDQDLIGRFYAERKVGTGQVAPWAIPWSVLPMALAYNADALVKIPHVSGGAVSKESVDPSTKKWIAPPKNLTEWLALCDDVKAFKSNDGKKYAPFGWTSVHMEQILYFMHTWWAQYQGLEKSNIPGQGSYYDFWNFGNKDQDTRGQVFSTSVFDQKGLAATLDNIKKLIIDDKKQGFKNSMSDVNTMTTQELTRAMYAEKNTERPIIAVASSFGEAEAKLDGSWDSNSDGKRDTDVRFMNIPALDGHEKENYLYCSTDEVAVVPFASEHKDLAKEFLTFAFSEDQNIKFTIRSGGGIRPFNYDARTITDDSITDYNKSVFDVYYTSRRISDFPLTAYKNKPLSVSLIFSFEHPLPFGGLEMTAAINMLKKGSNGTEVMKEGKRLFDATKQDYTKKYHMTEVK